MTERVTVNPIDFVPYGTDQIQVRLRLNDKRDIAKAAAYLGITQAQFMRNVLVSAARLVVAEKEAA